MVKYVYLNRFDGSGVPENLNTNMVTNSDISVTISSDVLNEINETLQYSTILTNPYLSKKN